MKKFKFLLIFRVIVGILFLSGCEFFYDPIRDNDVPASPAATWNKVPMLVKKTTEIPYEVSDLSGSMTLGRLLDIALYNNPSTRSSWNAARAAAYAYRASLSNYYPNITYVGTLNAQTSKGSPFANSSQGVITTPTTSTTATQSFLTDLTNSLSLTYLLLDFGGRSAIAEENLWALYSSDWSHNFTMQQVMLSVLNAYVSYIGNQALVAAFAQDLKDAETALSAAKLMRESGLSTLTDVLLAQSNLELIRTNLIQAQGAEKTAIGDLLITVGLPADSELSIEQLPQELPVIEITGDLSSLLELAREKRPDLGVAVASIKQLEAQLALTYSNSMPNLTANANWSQVRFISPSFVSGYNETLLLQLNVPIFEGFSFMNQRRQLRAQIEQAMANLDVQLAAVFTQVVTNYYLLTSAEAAMPSSLAAVESSERAFRGFVLQYKTGTSSILDVLTSLTTLMNARAQLISTRTQWAGALANLAFATGVLFDNSGNWQKNPPKKFSQLSIQNDASKNEDNRDTFRKWDDTKTFEKSQSSKDENNDSTNG